MKAKYLLIIVCIGFISCVQARRFGQLKAEDSLRPLGMRRTFERGFGDRYYYGVPGGHYRFFWPRWKRTIYDNQNIWRFKHAPNWVTYYDYPYTVWPNKYYLFGVPYYNRSKPKTLTDTELER